MLNYKIFSSSNNTKMPWLVFLAGFTGTMETWSLLCNELIANTQLSILLIDNLGAGNSPQPNELYTTNTMAHEILNTIAHLKINDIILIGHSLGGAIAQEIAIKKALTIKKLFLLSSFAKLDQVAIHFLTSRYDLMKANIEKNLIAKTSIASLFANSFLSKESNIALAKQRFINNPQTLPGMRGQLSACLAHNSTNYVAQINCPTIIITGADDVLVHPNHSKYLATNIPNSKILKFKECGHMIQLEQTNKLAKIIIKNLI